MGDDPSPKMSTRLPVQGPAALLQFPPDTADNDVQDSYMCCGNPSSLGSRGTRNFVWAAYGPFHLSLLGLNRLERLERPVGSIQVIGTPSASNGGDH